MSCNKPGQAGGGQPPPPVACPGESPCSLGGQDPSLQGNADVLPGTWSLAGSSSRGGSGLDSPDLGFHVSGMDQPSFPCLNETMKKFCTCVYDAAKNNTREAGSHPRNPDILYFCTNPQSDGSNFQIDTRSTVQYIPCLRKNCFTCGSYYKWPLAVAHTTGLKFASVCDANELRCTTKNLIYVLTCKRCGVQYVGETKRELHCRYMEHIRSIKKNQLNTYLVEHFNQPGHSCDDLFVQILEVITEDDSKNYRESRECFWIKALVTAYPFGLNDKIKGYGNISNELDPINSKCHPYFAVKMPSKLHKRTRKTKKRSNKNIDWQKINNFTYCLINCNITSKQMYKASCNISKKEWKILLDKTSEVHSLSSYKTLTLKAITAAKFKINQICHKTGPHKPQIRVIVPFVNKILDHINLNSMFNQIVYKNCANSTSIKTSLTQVVYKYQLPIGVKLFNYNKVLQSLDNNSLIANINGSCKCHLSKFNYIPHGHVITGDCEVIDEINLQQLLSNGTKFRPINNNQPEEVIGTCFQAFNNFISQFKTKLAKYINRDVFQENIVYNNFVYTIHQKMKKFNHIKANNDQQDLCRSLKYFNHQNQWIITCADKASGNFVFTCKKFYIMNLAAELGIDFKTGQAVGNKTYHYIINQTSDSIISAHQNFQASFGIKVSNADLILPCFYAIPKLHKEPYKFRYIVGAKKSSIKPISCLLLKILQLFRSHFINYTKKAKNFNGLNYNWSINDSTQALNVVNKAKNIKNAKTMIAADFSTMYTMLEHDTVLKSITYLANLLFNNTGKQFICVGYENAFYSDNHDFSGQILDRNDVLEIVNFVLDNTYFKFADYIFKQVCGIPMGGNASPLLADLTLSVLEFQYLKSNISYMERQQLSLTCRYIDDVLNINCPNFLKVCDKIYPATIPLEQTNPNDLTANYLDLNINLNKTNKNNVTKLHDKTSQFKFTVIKLVPECSNISGLVQYNIFYAQLLRFAKINSNVDDFLVISADLYTDFVFFGYCRKTLAKKVRKLYMNYPALFLKYNVVNRQDFMKLVFNKIIY